jgi:hypothetical protein
MKTEEFRKAVKIWNEIVAVTNVRFKKGEISAEQAQRDCNAFLVEKTGMTYAELSSERFSRTMFPDQYQED